MSLLWSLRSALALLAALLLWIPYGVVFRLAILPGAWLWPHRQPDLVSWFMKSISRGIFRCFWLGGARFRRTGVLPTREPILVIMNHQSQLDIITVTMMAQPHVPAFVTRKRYERFIPLVSGCIRLLGCPMVDPKRDARGAVEAVRRTALEGKHSILIFPEGHRTKNGEVQPFRTAGLVAVLQARRMPVYLCVTDGFWKGRRLVDFLENIHRIRGETEVLGPFAPPDDEGEIPAFIESLRETLVAHLHEMRARRATPA